ncbi:MAG TPA: gluconokinase [Thermomicrobiales bacterium]|nr:gluconokinase [Thermomicrobiales bacterium]
MKGRPAAATPLVLALDIGTSSTRAMVFDRDGQALDGLEVQTPYRLMTTADGGVEGDPEELARVAEEVIDGVLERAGDLAGEIRAVGVSCFWHSLLGLDGDGEPLTPVYSWADTRSAAAADKLRDEVDEDLLHDRTGCVFHTSYWPAKLRWLAATQLDTVRRVAHWGGYAEYLALRLTGTLACSVSMASGTGLLDQHTADWYRPLIERLDLDPDRLPPLVDRDDGRARLRPEYAKRWPALKDVPWYPAVGDGACNNVGSGCVTPARMALSIGTSGVMRVVVPAEEVIIPRRLWCYRIDHRRYVLGGALSNAGNVADWLRATTRLPDDAAQQVAALAPDSHGLTILPFLAGERTPEWRPRARAAFVGLALDTTPLEILRAGLEAVACRFALVHELLRPLAGQEYQIVCSGGGVAHWPVWPQIIADALGVPLVEAKQLEASARGAAVLALDALGVYEDLADAPAPLGRTYTPDADAHAAYRAERGRLEWLNAVLAPQFDGGSEK